jgi:hypothetical protein
LDEVALTTTDEAGYLFSTVRYEMRIEEPQARIASECRECELFEKEDEGASCWHCPGRPHACGCNAGVSDGRGSVIICRVRKYCFHVTLRYIFGMFESDSFVKFAAYLTEIHSHVFEAHLVNSDSRPGEHSSTSLNKPSEG